MKEEGKGEEYRGGGERKEEGKGGAQKYKKWRLVR